MNSNQYCFSRQQSIRRKSREVHAGEVYFGGSQPIRVQSMTTSLTQDVDATVTQALRLAEVGCELVRITAPNKEAARCLGEISRKLRAAGCRVPLVADIHFLPSAAMEAVEHVEKVRVNPGNYADKKKFAVREYTDAQYNEELQRLHDAFSPLVKRAKALGRCLRIGTNHGSLSDRIMNRYGDSPLGMVESALEFIRIAESHGFHNLCVSMKASNPKIMIQAYRLAVAKMAAESMEYPLHLGVTEAGDGEDARVKSAIGIGALLADGLGDTIRVSLTEDPWYEIPVCIDLARRAETLWAQHDGAAPTASPDEALDPFEFKRREIIELGFGPETVLSPLEPPRVIVPAAWPASQPNDNIREISQAHARLKDARAEGILFQIDGPQDLSGVATVRKALRKQLLAVVLALPDQAMPEFLDALPGDNDEATAPVVMICRRFEPGDADALEAWAHHCRSTNRILAVDAEASTLLALADPLSRMGPERMVFTYSGMLNGIHALGAYRALAAVLHKLSLPAPLWIRAVAAHQIDPANHYGAILLEDSIIAGGLFADGLGDLISIENAPDSTRATALAYNILQGARMRATRTEFVACPSCGRTLFDLQSVTARIRGRTGHLKGVTIAVMGCIVNGPGEMADADFGYVGGAPGKINLYVGKECVKYNIPETEALDRLVDLIKAYNKWQEPLKEPV